MENSTTVYVVLTSDDLTRLTYEFTPFTPPAKALRIWQKLSEN
jgi:hypothetical protein